MNRGDSVYVDYDGKEQSGTIVIDHNVNGERMYFVRWDSGSCWYNAPLVRMRPKTITYKQITLFDEDYSPKDERQAR